QHVHLRFMGHVRGITRSFSGGAKRRPLQAIVKWRHSMPSSHGPRGSAALCDRLSGSSRNRHLAGGTAGARGVLEYRPTGWPVGSRTRAMAPVPSGRLKGNPATTVPPSSFDFLQLAWISVT